MEENGDKTAARLLKMAEEPAGFLSTIQIGITLAGFLGSAFAAESFSDGLVLSCLSSIPKDGSTVEVETQGLSIRTERIRNRRIESVLIKKIEMGKQTE